MRKLLKLVAILSFAATGQVSYAVVEFDLNTVINGSTHSGESSSRMTTKFTKSATGNVTLKLTKNMMSERYINDLLFNRLVDPLNRYFAPGPPEIGFGQTSVGRSNDFVTGLGAGLLNTHIAFNFNTSTLLNNINSPVVLDIWDTGLTDNPFNMLSAHGGSGFSGTTTYLMATEVQGFHNSSTVSVGFNNVTAVPKPKIFSMMGVGLLLMGFVVHRRRQQGLA